jgi:hypothetical protein
MDNGAHNVSAILTQRWARAESAKSSTLWLSVAHLAAVIADEYEHDKDRLKAATYRGIYEEAYKRASQLMDKEQA